MSDPSASSAPAAASTLPGWQGILEAGETILWQGQPDRRFRVEFDSLRHSLPGLFMVAFALFWMYQAARGSGIFALFGLIFVGVGLRQFLEPMIWPAYLRSRSWYTLTDRRAIVATDVPFRGRRLTSYPLGSDTLVEFVDGDPASILFGPEGGAKQARPGFYYIDDAREVMPMIRRVQQGRATAADSAANEAMA